MVESLFLGLESRKLYTFPQALEVFVEINRGKVRIEVLHRFHLIENLPFALRTVHRLG